MTTPADPGLKTRRDQIIDAHILAETSTHDIAAALATFRHPRYEVPAGLSPTAPRQSLACSARCSELSPISGSNASQPTTPTMLSSSNAGSEVPIGSLGGHPCHWQTHVRTGRGLRGRRFGLRKGLLRSRHRPQSAKFIGDSHEASQNRSEYTKPLGARWFVLRCGHLSVVHIDSTT
jgi:hypothetical protein